MNEVEIVRRVLDAPEQDPKAQERARARLREAMASELPAPAGIERRRPLLRPARWLGVAAAIVTAVLIGQTVLSQHEHAPIAAATELRRLASVAAASRPVRIPAGKVISLSSESTTNVTESSDEDSNQDLTTGQTYDLSVQRSVHTFIAPDGSGTRISTITNLSFPTEQDHQMWLALKPSEYQIHKVTTDVILPGELSQNRDLSTLPTDPAGLLTALRIPSIGKGSLDDGQVMSDVETILSQANPSPALRAALFQVLAGLPGIRSLGQVQDPAGRTGVGFMLPEGSKDVEIVVDPATSNVLATIIFNAGNDGSARSWSVNTGSAVVSRPHASA